jgi:hypothetical protein
MKLSRLVWIAALALYLVTVAWAYGLVVGTTIILLLLSACLLCTPLASYVVVLSVLLGGAGHRVMTRNLEKDDSARANVPRQYSLTSFIYSFWSLLLVFNIGLLYWLPKIYSLTRPTEFLYHVLRIPATGGFLVALTGASVVFHWITERYAGVMSRLIYHIVGAVAFSIVFYFFFQSPYYEELVISLNSSSVNY